MAKFNTAKAKETLITAETGKNINLDQEIGWLIHLAKSEGMEAMQALHSILMERSKKATNATQKPIYKNRMHEIEDMA